MNLSHLQYFRELSKTQSYTKAARNLYISQPTLSHSIATLEEELECKLFRKAGRGIVLTDEGKLFSNYVDDSLRVLEKGIIELEKRRGRLSGIVRLGAIQSVRTAFLPEAMLSYRRTRGTLVELAINQGSTNELIFNLRQGIDEFAVTSEFKGNGFEFTPLFKQRLVVIVHKGHPLASHKSVSIHELKDALLYTYREGIIVGSEVNSFLIKHGLNPSEMNLNRDSDDEMILGGLVSRAPVVGLGVDSSGLAPYKDLVTIPLKEKDAQQLHPIGILKVAGKQLSPVAQNFMDFLVDFARNYYHEGSGVNPNA